MLHSLQKSNMPEKPRECLMASKWIDQGKNRGWGWQRKFVMVAALSTLSGTEPHVIEERLNWREPHDRGEEYSAACWYEDYPLLEVAERIKWESKGLLTESRARGCRCVADRCVLWSADKGTVQKVIVLPRDDLQTEELVLEEVEVFKVSCSLRLLHLHILFSVWHVLHPLLL